MASKEEKRRLIGGYAASGMTRREYCAKHGIAVSTLNYWRLKRKPKLARVEIAPQQAFLGRLLFNLRPFASQMVRRGKLNYFSDGLGF